MSLRRKLFLSFIAASLFGVTLFGYITYVTTRNAQIDELTNSTTAASRQLATILAEQNLPAIRQTLQKLQSRDQAQYYEIIITAADQTIVFNMLDSSFTPAVIQRLLDSNKQEDYLETDDRFILWSKQPINGSNYSLYLLRQVDKGNFASFLKSSGVPLFIAGIIILWLAFWGAMILGSLYQRVERQRQELKYQTLHDSLTGLPNRNWLVEQAEIRLQQPLEENECIALLIIDIKRIKEINDTLGHYAGDTLLCMIADRLRSVIRGNDLLARIVSNEFGLLFDSAPQESVLTATSRIQAELNKGFSLDEHEFYLGASIGVAFYPEHALDAINLIQHGEMAMYAAKRIGTDIAIYDETHKTSTLEQLKLINDLRTDLENRNIHLYFQPKIDIKNRKVVSLEALARWEHPNHGHIATSRFIHIAENTGLINTLTHLVMENALQRACNLQELGLSLNMAINLSVWNLQDPDIVDYLRDLLEQYRLQPSQVTLEITETAMMINHKRALHTLNRLHEMGVLLSVDDFGTGYSSMAYLKQLPLNEVKIDKSFIKSMNKRADDSSMVRAMIDLSHDLGLSVVGEGVENAEIEKILQGLGCDLGQGSYYAEAMPFDELLPWMEQFNKQSGTSVL